jgi:nucleotide-binding universal stress UspA family protein
MKILVGYDGSSSADAAIEDLRRAGLPHKASALLVVSVADGALPALESGVIYTASPDSWRHKLEEAESLARKAADRIASYFPEWTITSEGLWGSPAKIIFETSEWWHPDLIVVGSHGRSAVSRLFLGSVSLELIHKAQCSVRVTRAKESFPSSVSDEPIRLIIGTDGSTESDTVIRSVAARSWLEGTEAHVISVVQTLVPAIVPSELSNTDAIFVGARGLGGMERLLLGSVSSHILTHAHCTVEVVRGC